MCKESQTTQQTDSSGTSTTSLPGWLNKASKGLAQQAQDYAARDFVPYTDDRVAEFNPDQETGFQLVRDTVAGAPDLLPETLDMGRTYANTPAQTLPDLGRVVDENNVLGMMADYFDPYLKAAEGPLQTALRKIDEAAAQGAKGINRQASLGIGDPFSDLRTALMQTENEKNRMIARGDTTGQMLRQALDSAMAMRTGDLNRFFQQGITQAGLNETALGRLLQGAQSLLGFQGTDQAADLQRIAAMLGIGGTQQGNAQAELDAQYQEFLREMGWDKDSLLTAADVISGVPRGSTTTSSGTVNTVNTQPDNSLLQLAGTVAGAALAPVTAGGSTAIRSLLSDRRAKTDITPVGRLDNGLTVYRFRYKDGGPFQIGLMADEVEKIAPHAVSERVGLKFVDYAAATV